MLGLGTSLVTQGFSEGTPPPVTLATYASDFSSNLNGWADSVASTTITGNNDAVVDQTSTSKDDCLKVEFTSTLTSNYELKRNNTLASGGISAGDTVSVSFSCLFQDPDNNSSGTRFYFQLGSYDASRVKSLIVFPSIENLWLTNTFEFTAPAATPSTEIILRWSQGSYYPKENNLFYMKDISVTHSGQAR